MINGTERGLCCEPRCKNRRRKDRLRCYTCDTRRNRRRHPMMAAYHCLKSHARARGIAFRLTFYVFRQFALKSQYLTRKGRDAGSLTVDRKNNLRGYVNGNIQPMTRAANSEKKAKQDAIRMRCGMAWQEHYEHSS